MQRLLDSAPYTSRAPQRSHEPDQRAHELDWLRAFIILALVPTHAMGFFSTTTSKYFGTQYSSPIGLSTLMSLGTWGIALLFLISGAAASYMLNRHSLRRFVSERCIRLLIPILFASLTLIPLQDYLLIHAFPSILTQIPTPAGWDPHVADSPVAFYQWFVGGYASFLIHYTPRYEFIFWSHLWFIPRLLAISLLTLPLLLYLRSGRGMRVLSSLAGLCMHYRGAVFLLAVPLILINAIFGWQWQGWQVVGAPDSANVLAQFMFYAVVYVYGFVLYTDTRLRFVVRRDGTVAAIAAALLVFIISQFPAVGNQALAHDYSAGGFLSATLRSLAAWLFIVGIAGLCMRFLAFSNWVGQYLTAASYPFYVLHLAVLYAVGLPLLTVGVPALLSFIVIVVLTYIFTFALYELLIRRIRPLRVLFGMRAQSQPVPLEQHAGNQ